MAEGKVAYIFRFDYELKPGSSWTAHILAYSLNDARNYLTKNWNPNRINSHSQICRVDAVTDELREVIATPLLPHKKKVGRPPKKKN